MDISEMITHIKTTLFTFFLSINLFSQTTPLITAGALWRYLDTGVQPTNTWNQKTFTDSNPNLFSSLSLNVLRDDGVIVYINGVEVYRDNMPAGQVNSSTLASSTISLGGESTWHPATLSSTYLNSGSNVIAVEIHQDAANSSDISFNLSLDGTATPITTTIDRGPYLNMGTQNSMIVKWRTTQSTDSRVYYGTGINNLNQTSTNPTFTTNHEVTITGLLPNTKYYYQVGTTSNTLSLADSNAYFKTSPMMGKAGHYSFWAIGDAGTGDNNQRNVKSAFLNYTQNKSIDGWIWLGDNAYDNGYDSQYQSNVFSNNIYENVLKRIVVWPAPGNHDYNNHIPLSPSPAYYDIFSLPTQAEAGGVASGTEKYYSYNYGNIHFIVLDSYDEGRNTTDPMATWLTNDLANNTLPWTIAYWHHPPYTKGSHNSDNSNFLDGELVDIRENIIPIIENGGVDLVLNGHSHSYERSFLMDGHYGYSSSLQNNMIKDNGIGNYPTNCPYQKNTTLTKAHKGTIYAVCGCSGKLSTVSSGWPHPVMASYSKTEYGSMLIEVEDNKLVSKFITSTGSVSDNFTIIKNAGKKYTLTTCPGQALTLKPSWPGSVSWNNNSTLQDSLVVSPTTPTTYYAYDPLSCIKDTFVVNISNSPSCINFINNENTDLAFSIYPNPFSKQNAVFHISGINQIEKVEIRNCLGQLVEHTFTKENDLTSQIKLSCEDAGIYNIKIYTSNGQTISQKLILLAE